MKRSLLAVVFMVFSTWSTQSAAEGGVVTEVDMNSLTESDAREMVDSMNRYLDVKKLQADILEVEARIADSKAKKVKAENAAKENDPSQKSESELRDEIEAQVKKEMGYGDGGGTGGEEMYVVEIRGMGENLRARVYWKGGYMFVTEGDRVGGLIRILRITSSHVEISKKGKKSILGIVPMSVAENGGERGLGGMAVPSSAMQFPPMMPN